MLKDILPLKIYDAIKKLNGKLNEIRIRCNMPLIAVVDGKKEYIGDLGVAADKNYAIVVTHENIEEIVLKSVRYSLYASNEQIKQGFISVSGGIRIGVCGEIVYAEDRIKTVKNLTSLNIRIANEIYGFSDFIIKYIYDKKILSTLILSPPSCGKTTLLRDIARRISTFSNLYNIVVIDERMEIASVLNGKPLLDVGYSDVLSGCLKADGITMATRTLAPDVIICDEIKELKEFEAVSYAATCGVSIIASMHAASIEEFLAKKDFQDNKNFLFKRYIVLSNSVKVGTFEKIYDENFSILYER